VPLHDDFTAMDKQVKYLHLVSKCRRPNLNEKFRARRLYVDKHFNESLEQEDFINQSLSARFEDKSLQSLQKFAQGNSRQRSLDRTDDGDPLDPDTWLDNYPIDPLHAIAMSAGDKR